MSRLALYVIGASLLSLLAGVVVADQPSTARDITADYGGIVVNGSVGGSVGLTPVKLKELMVEYARQDSAAVQQVMALSKQLGVTKGALAGFFETLEQNEVPSDQLATRLSEIARDHKKLLAEVATFRGEDDPDIARLGVAVEAALRDGRNEEARSLLTKAMTANIAAADKLNSAMSKHKRRAAEKAAALGALAITQFDYRSAGVSFAEAAALCPPDDALLRANYLSNAGKAEYSAGRYPAATVFLGDALAIREKALGPEHPDTVTSLNNLALLYQAQGQYDAAVPLYSRALAIRERVLGPEHPDTATSLNNLALLYQAQGQYDAAVPLYMRAVSIREKVLGPNHPATGTSLNNLAALYQAQGMYDAAEPLYNRALAITEKAFGPDDPATATSLNNLAALYQAQGKYNAAASFYIRAFTITAKALGPDDPATAISLNNLVGYSYVEDQFDVTATHITRALTTIEKALGPNHPNTVLVLKNLAKLRQAQGQSEEAKALFAEAKAREKRAASQAPAKPAPP